MLMDQTDPVPELVRGHLPNMCKDSDHWALCRQCECKLDAHTHLQGNGETHPRTLLALEELQERHLEGVPAQELQEHHQYIHMDKQCLLQSHQLWYKQASEAQAQGLALGQTEMEQELAGKAARVLPALLSTLQVKHQLREDSLVPKKCGKQLQGQAPAP